MASNYIVTILNWEKYNARKDIARPWWYAQSHDFFYDAKFYDFDNDEVVCWFYILMEASRHERRGVAPVNSDHAHRVRNISTEVLDRTLKKLKLKRIVEVRSVRGTYAIRTDAYATRHNSTLQNKTLQDIPPVDVPVRDTVAESPSAKFIGTYVAAFKKRYGEKSRPDVGGKVQGGIKRLLSSTPLDRACDMIQVYLQMDDDWFKTKAHDFGTFEQNLTKVGLALDTGKKRGGRSQWDEEMLAKERAQNELLRIQHTD
jgi:hypothetical protein